MGDSNQLISVVVPTYYRPDEVRDLLENLNLQSFLPYEVILVDGSPLDVKETEDIFAQIAPKMPFHCKYIRSAKGTAIQRNTGINVAQSDFIAFIDDDIRLEPDFFKTILGVFEDDEELQVGGIAGYIINQYLNPITSLRWVWNRRLRLYTTYEPGRYDFQSGYPVNRYLQAPHNGIREIDFMGSNCAVWRREVFNTGLRFSLFFKDYGVLEDAHLALRAGRRWKLLECGRACCTHLHSSSGRENTRSVARKTAVNYRFVFVDIVPDRTLGQEFRFWRMQLVDLIRFILYAVRHSNKATWGSVIGKVEGIFAAISVHPEARIQDVVEERC
jgi:glycosyltransferase involved in cell wall biosynthesis